MTIPLLQYPPTSQNQRVEGFEIPSDESPRRHSLNEIPVGTDFDDIIRAAYRQIFNEQQIVKAHRLVFLESQLRFGQLTMREFIRGLLVSDHFRRLNYEANNNYRFVELCVQRVLGRSPYNRKETLAWSVVLATKGLAGFVDDLLASDEYEANFGEDCVPYQRRRILPQRTTGELPIARMARYGAERRDLLFAAGLLQRVSSEVVDRSAAVYRRVLYFFPATAVVALIVVILLATTPG